MRRQHPHAATRMPCACSCRTTRPPSLAAAPTPVRCAEGRRRARPAGLDSPPTASNDWCTFRRASSWRSLSSGSRPVPGTRRVGIARRGVEVGDDEGGLEVLGGVVHRLRDGAGSQHLAERVDGPVVHDDVAVGIGLANLLELAAADLVRFHVGATRGRARAHRPPRGRQPYRRLASLTSAWRVQSSRTSSGRSTTTPW
jgi:hypothetical protein